MKINQSFHVLMNKFENPPDYGNFVPIMLNVMTKISLIVVPNLPDCKMQMLAALLGCTVQLCMHLHQPSSDSEKC